MYRDENDILHYSSVPPPVRLTWQDKSVSMVTSTCSALPVFPVECQHGCEKERHKNERQIH